MHQLRSSVLQTLQPAAFSARRDLLGPGLWARIFLRAPLRSPLLTPRETAPKGLLERSDDRAAARMVQDGEVYEPEYSAEIAGQRFQKLRRDIAGVVFEYATAPSA